MFGAIDRWWIHAAVKFAAQDSGSSQLIEMALTSGREVRLIANRWHEGSGTGSLYLLFVHISTQYEWGWDMELIYYISSARRWRNDHTFYYGMITLWLDKRPENLRPAAPLLSGTLSPMFDPRRLPHLLILLILIVVIVHITISRGMRWILFKCMGRRTYRGAAYSKHVLHTSPHEFDQNYHPEFNHPDHALDHQIWWVWSSVHMIIMVTDWKSISRTRVTSICAIATKLVFSKTLLSIDTRAIILLCLKIVGRRAGKTPDPPGQWVAFPGIISRATCKPLFCAS